MQIRGIKILLQGMLAKIQKDNNIIPVPSINHRMMKNLAKIELVYSFLLKDIVKKDLILGYIYDTVYYFGFIYKIS